MKTSPPFNGSADISLFSGEHFSNWSSLNDSIMGGKSNSFCEVTQEGLILKGDIVEEGGGFVSCRSPLLSPPMDLSAYRAFQLEVEGDGRTLKFAVACADMLLGLTEIFSGGLRWTASVPTEEKGITKIIIPFDNLESTVRAKRVKVPFGFRSSAVTQFQLLHSRFGQGGERNSEFKEGPIRILLRSISAVS